MARGAVDELIARAAEHAAAHGYRREGGPERDVSEALLAAVDADGATVLCDVAAALEQHALPDRAIHDLASDLAWRLRARGSAPTWGTVPHRGWAARLFVELVEAQTLRFDFRVRALAERVAGAPADLAADQLLAALGLFAREASGAASRGSGRLVAAVEAALAAPTIEFRVAHVLLHALWLDLRDADRATLLLAFADRMVDGGLADANVAYRAAAAHRRLGEFAAAAARIDEAIDQLGPGAPEVHQDYVRERELIAMAEQIVEGAVGALERELDQARRTNDEQLHALRRELDQTVQEVATRTQEAVNRSLIGVVEILALFVTIAGVLAATGAVTLPALRGTDAWWQALLVLAGAAVFLGGTFLTLHHVVHRPLLRPTSWPGQAGAER